MLLFYTRTARSVLPYCLLLLLLLSSLPSLAQTVLYVKPGGTGDGSSWANASGDIQAMISKSPLKGQIWVAKGIFKPTLTKDRTISFIMRDDVAIYGGFTGTEAKLEERKLTSPSSTTLSGDIGDNEVPSDNSYHIIRNKSGLTADAILDGFVITSGNANRRAEGDDYGGGIWNNGGGNGQICSPTIRNCWFDNNLAVGNGGAINNYGINGGTSNPNISNCRFQNNTSTGNGGAIFNDGYKGESNPILANCSFQDNKATWGGALYNSGISRPQITSCSFLGNSALQSGGAIYNQGDGGNSSPKLTNCSFESNSAKNRGGAMYNDGTAGTSSPSLTNCSFQSNSAAEGGALYDFSQYGGNSNPTLTNCSFTGNKAGQGGALFNNVDEPNGDNIAPGNGHPVLVNCVFFGNGDGNTIYIRTNPSISGDTYATYCLFDASVGGYTGSNNIKTTIPPFASTTSTQLALCSQAINAGDPGTPQKFGETDLAGNIRLLGDRIDMGAYEAAFRLYVKKDAPVTNKGRNWNDAYPDLQSALNYTCSNGAAASGVTEIWVAKGIYKPTATTGPDSRTISFAMRNGVAIYGDFVGTEDSLKQRRLTFPLSTTLSGDIGTPNNSTDNSYHVFNNRVTLNRSAVLDGFVITGGASDSEYGGGMYSVRDCNQTLRNCLFQANSALSGGGIYNNGSPDIINCAFQNNTATYGGAMLNDGETGAGSLQLFSCSFQNNTASSAGAIYNKGNSTAVLANCVLFGNGGNNTFFNQGAASLFAIHSLFEPSAVTVARVDISSNPGNITTTTSPFASTATTQLAPCSAAIDAGDAEYMLTTTEEVTDLAGNPRIVNNRIDMGAYEFNSPVATRLYVRKDATGTNTGESWANAYTDLQSALNYTCGGGVTEIWVAKGVYTPTATTGPDSRTISFAMRKGIAVYGGFAGTETSLAQRKLTFPLSTTLSGDIGTVGSNADNSYHVIYNPAGLDDTAILDGFVITGGNANGTNANRYDFSGGGMFNNGLSKVCSPTIRNCLFQANTASSKGGAMYNDGRGNGTSNPKLINCAFRSNSALVSEGQGGAICNDGAFGTSRPILTNCSFQSNSANTGGAICNFVGTQQATGTSRPVLVNCVFFGNGGSNSIASVGPNTGISATYSLLETAFDGTGNITTTTSPFASSATAQLDNCTVAINAGDPNTTTATVGTTDLAGNPRVFGTAIDMGAYENQTSLTLTAGAIGRSSAIVPYPKESPNFLTNVSVGTASGGTPFVYSWEQSTDGAQWTAMTGSTSTSAVELPSDLESAKNEFRIYQLRRVTSACGQRTETAPVSVSVWAGDGSIAGTVFSKGATPVGVKGVTIRVVRTTPGLAGSANLWTYTAVTGDNGTYSIPKIYYGIPEGETPFTPKPVFKSSFSVTPSYVTSGITHTFTKAVETRELDIFAPSGPPPIAVDFVDQTSYAISGQAFQTCPDCLTLAGYKNPVNVPAGIGIACPVDGVTMSITDGRGTIIPPFSTTALATKSGSYAFTPSNPGTYTITAAKSPLVFSLASFTVAVPDDKLDQHVYSPTSHTITGTLMAGCGENIVQTATLKFSDILPDGSTCFSKEVKLTGSSYRVVLPPRNYKVEVTAFVSTPEAKAKGIQDEPVKQFFVDMESRTRDSLRADLTSAKSLTLNLTYQRPPTLLLTGLSAPTSSSCTTVLFGLAKQGEPTSLSVSVFQGPASNGCPVGSRVLTTTAVGGNTLSSTVVSGTLLVTSDIRGTSAIDTLPVVKGVGSLSLVPGTPNITLIKNIPNNVPDGYYRTINTQYTDLFGRKVTPPTYYVAVTGFNSDSAKAFTTSSPQIPFMVLHDPPGDASYSFFEKGTTQEHAFRMFASVKGSVKTMAEVKAGFKFSKGFGVTTESKFEAKLGGSVTIEGRANADNELILNTKVGERIETSQSPNAVGADADVFVGAAINFQYAQAVVIDYNPKTCLTQYTRSLQMAPIGTKTEFRYSQAQIKDQIKVKQAIIDFPTSTTADRDEAAIQIKAWQQVLANNEKNKREAAFIKNISFDAGVGPGTEFVSSLSSRSNTIELALNLNTEVSTALEIEESGVGFSAGLTYNFQVEISTSERNTVTRETTTGFVLKDGSDENGRDVFTVDIKSDPVYGSPVFDLLAGSSSCPPEANTIARDAVSLRVEGSPVRTNIPNGESVEFVLYLSNISRVLTDASRDFTLSLVNNPDNAEISTGLTGSFTLDGPKSLTASATEKKITVRVKKDANSPVYAYPDIQFEVRAACGGTVLQRVSLAAFFQSPCSNVSLGKPEADWRLAGTEPMQVLMKDYVRDNLTDISLQYKAIASSGEWITVPGFTKTKADLDDTPLGTQFPWAAAGLNDGAYGLRLKLTCPLAGGAIGTTYTQQVNGVVDRTPPVPVGAAQPYGNVYVLGSQIGINYNEPLVCPPSGGLMAQARTLTGQVVSVTANCADGRVVITPVSLLPAYLGNVISVTLTGVADLYGNKRVIPDIWKFQVGEATAITSATAATGSNSLSVAITGSPLSESSTTGTIRVVFSLPQNTAKKNVPVNFGVAGTARFGVDYRATFVSSSTLAQPASVTMNGVGGTILIPNDVTSATLVLAPINNSLYEPDRTILISLLDGGDYQISAASSVSAVIVNDDPLPNPSASLTLVTSATPTAICIGGIVNLSVSATGGSGPYSYTWTAPTEATLGGTSTSAVSATVTTAGVRLFTVRVSGLNGTSVTTGTVSVTVNAPPAPTLTAGPSATLSCAQSSLTLTAGGGVTGAPFTYHFAGPGISSQGLTDGKAVVNVAGTYSVTVTNASGCVATASTVISENNGTQRTQITAQPASSSVVTVGASVSVPLSATGTNLTYRWTRDGSVLAGVTTSVLNLTGVTTSQSGTYVCTVSGDCGTAVSQAFVLTVNAAPVILAVEPLVTPLQLTIYPNPATSDRVWVTVRGAEKQPVHLQLMDMKGRMVWERHIEVVAPEHTEQLDLDNLATGLMLLRASTPEQSQTKKLIKL